MIVWGKCSRGTFGLTCLLCAHAFGTKGAKFESCGGGNVIIQVFFRLQVVRLITIKLSVVL